jgi:hypothetical protein
LQTIGSLKGFFLYFFLKIKLINNFICKLIWIPHKSNTKFIYSLYKNDYNMYIYIYIYSICVFVVTNCQKGRFEAIKSIRAPPSIIVRITIEKVQLSTLATIFSLFSPTDYLFLSLLAFKYYFSFFFIISLPTLN